MTNAFHPAIASQESNGKTGFPKEDRSHSLKIEFLDATENGAHGASTPVPVARLTNISKYNVRIWESGFKAYFNLKVEVINSKGRQQLLRPVPPAFVPDFSGVLDLAPGKTHLRRYPLNLERVKFKELRIIFEFPRDGDAIACKVWTGRFATPFRSAP
ncbi:MAG: hypothetical protein K2X93_01010 [Candidatus Obscuribacterales bacterium]|nr:hypothetical protein [Candidatus Obscuribacterales bacterium]